MKLSFLFTCYNRREKTIGCIKSIKKAMDYCENNGIDLAASWYITDAGSNDGTVEAIDECLGKSGMHMRVGNSNTFYSQGMRKCLEDYLSCEENDADAFTGYVFLINDDVCFYEDFLYKLLMDNSCDEQAVLVGATDCKGNQTYGGIRYEKGVNGKTILPRSVKYKMISLNDDNRKCHSFNANCVMIPGAIVRKIGPMDGRFVHSLGDFDYGLCIYEKGYSILTTRFFVGECSNNERGGSWMDTNLSRKERINRLNSVKGAPTKYWFYYLNKHFGLSTALIYSLSPYIRILLGK